MDSKRVIDIILEEAMKVEERFLGYREELRTLVAEIVSIERKHRFVHRNVRKDIAEQINNLGNELAEKLAQQPGEAK
ncbi:hypothetical protein NKH94_14695 [Mesorhizobium australicum]|uniref:hypothetical protein n=1 Tax=Mesorhizobium australicum TaxID=536018 RepID=UPI00333B353D